MKSVKLLLALISVLGLIAPAMPFGRANAAIVDRVELLDQRTRTSKTYWLGDDVYQFTGFTGSIHYKENPDDPYKPYKEIDETIVSSNKTNWDWEVTKGHWKLLIRDNTAVAMGKHGHWLGFHLDGLAYLDRSTKEYVILQERQNVTPIVSQNKIRWEEIFYGVNLEYVYTSDSFHENVEVTQKARDWAKNNPPSNYGLNNSTSYLTFYMKSDWENAYPAKDKYGIPVNWDYDNDFITRIDFWHPLKNYIVATFPPSWARAPPETEAAPVKIYKRFWRENDRHWLLFGSKITELNRLPSGTIIFDPDTFYPDADPESSSVDGIVIHSDNNKSWATIQGGAGSNSNDSAAENILVMLRSGSTSNWRAFYRGIFLFDTSGLPDGATITNVVMSIYGTATYTQDELGTSNVYNICASAPASNTALANGDYDSLGTIAYCDTAIAQGSWNTSGYNDWTFNAAGRAAVSKTGVSKFGVREFNYDVPNSEPGSYNQDKYSRISGYFADETGTSKDPKLVVTYTAAAPTVVTYNATSVEETTATLVGNITATGGENADERGFEWGTAPGNYTSNWTQIGSFGTGSYNHDITGLSDNTPYYYRAMAHNGGGWGYGSEVSFTTTPSPAVGVATTGAIPIDVPGMEIAPVLMMGLLTYVAFRRKDTFLLLVMCPALMAFGFYWYESYHGEATWFIVAIVTAAIGLYFLSLGIMNLLARRA